MGAQQLENMIEVDNEEAAIAFSKLMPCFY